MICSRCDGPIEDSDKFCRHCGYKLLRTPWYLSKAFVIVALLCVAILALPLLWKSPDFSKTEQIVWTVVLVVLTAAFVWMGVQVAQSLQQLSGMMAY